MISVGVNAEASRRPTNGLEVESSSWHYQLWSVVMCGNLDNSLNVPRTTLERSPPQEAQDTQDARPPEVADEASGRKRCLRSALIVGKFVEGVPAFGRVERNNWDEAAWRRPAGPDWGRGRAE